MSSSLKSTLLLFALITILFGISSCEHASPQNNTNSSPKVLTTILPYKFFVDKITNGLVTADVVVPEGASSHTFEPTAKQMLNSSNADIWFVIGDPFEKKMALSLKEMNPKIKVVDLREEIPNDLSIHTHSHCHHHCHNHHHQSSSIDSMDVHIWLSPRLAKIQAKVITAALIDSFPEHEKKFSEGLNQLLLELDQLDQEIASLLLPLKGRSIMVSHSAFSYFCQDYGLHQLSIECEGKDPKAYYAASTIDAAKRAGIQTIFIQKQCSNKGAFRVAEELGISTSYLNPYDLNYFDNMRSIAHAFHKESS